MIKDNFSDTWSVLIILISFYCLSTSVSIALLGDRNLLSGNLYRIKGLILLLTNWRFILSMTLAFVSRACFMLINNNFLKIPYLAGAATTLSFFVTLLSIGFILLANHFFLKETLNLRQAAGAAVILIGVFIMLYK